MEQTADLELWGGVECTVNRVGDRFRDQLHMTGHHDRPADLALFARLGIRALRFPVLWERVLTRSGDYDWTWTDARLAEIARLGMRPIAGLLHHGSGPADTSLVAEDFVPRFAAYAAAAAQRYPQVRDWTPVNEPLTTARFSALYGVWYPHATDRGQFWRAVLNQVEGTIAAMAAIRRHIPDARLIQTDDLGETFAEPAYQDRADYYNHRRWLAWDLLAGMVTPGHALWTEGVALGFADRLRVIADAPCPPDIIGVNHYLTSDRYLRASRSPDAPVEDMAAIRILDPAPGGLEAAVRQAWLRYRVPVAITESHLGCTREEQVRWVQRSWDIAQRLRGDGVDVRALTAWALMGNMDWVSLVTKDAGAYESGVYDVRGGTPRATAIAPLLASLAGQAAVPPHVDAIARQPGWWERDVRLEHPPVALPALTRMVTHDAAAGRPILITGANGALGRALTSACALRGLRYVATDRTTMPIEDADAVARTLDLHRPWAVVNAAGWTRIDAAEDNARACLSANRDGALVVSAACAARDVHCTIVSADLVFGDTAAPFDEGAAPAPLNLYGRSKQAAEDGALEAGERMLVVRSAGFFSPFDTRNFAMQVERMLADGQQLPASADHVMTPTYMPDLVTALLDLLVDGETGLWHLTHQEPVSWRDFAQDIARALGLNARAIVSASPEVLGWRAPRPRNAALRSSRGQLLPRLEHAIARHVGERRRAG
ncbi:MAG TPA: SDR family oxidoreductase [Sphingomonas sp.]|uniref:SDR family oxidoreductase n=1 Tax=Sphingomonas sp. TaxID=28214 RepID=UPI002ED8DB22